MSMWAEADAAPFPEPGPESEQRETDVAEPGDIEDGGDADESGVADGRRAVRVWVDDDRRLAGVLMSNRWRERLRGTTLEAAFAEALGLAQGRVAEPGTVHLPTTGDPHASGPALTWRTLHAQRVRLTDLRTRIAGVEADPAGIVAPRMVGAEVEASSGNGLVTVRLLLDGRTHSVRFDEGWLAEARVSDICDAVLEAHRQAYARWQPARLEPGTYDLLASEVATLGGDLATAIAKGAWA